MIRSLFVANLYIPCEPPAKCLLIRAHQTRFSMGFYAHPPMLNQRAGSHAKYPPIDVNNMLYVGDFNGYSRHHIAFKR